LAYTFIIAQTAGGTGASTGATTAAVNTTGAGLIVLNIGFDSGGSGLAVSDSASNTWTPLTVRNNGTVEEQLFYSASPTTSASHTFSVSGTNVYASITAAAFGGAAAPFDLQSGNVGSSNQPNAGSITPSQANELVIAGVACSASVTSIDSSFIIPTNGTIANVGGQHAGCGIAYLIQTTAAAANPNWLIGLSTNWAAEIAAFKAGAVVVPSSVSQRHFFMFP
jgi:hypothetical protein